MKTAACLLALFTLSGVARADGAAGFIGEPGCLVAKPALAANETIAWKGPCKDGYAAGTGVLERSRPGVLLGSVWARYEVTMVEGRFDGDAVIKYENGDSYKGQIKNGLRDGKGYTASANGDQYEGEYRHDRRHGKGVMLRHDQSEYTGDWKDGKFDGIGTMTFALGGRYDGAWKAGRFDGKGVLTYAGSGQRLDADFEDGRVRGTPAAVKPEETRYAMRGVAPMVGSSLNPKTVMGSVPFEKSYAQLTPEQQAIVKLPYMALEPGDEPPYPLHGPKPMFEWFKQAQDKVLVDGDLRLDVLVGKDGKVLSVKTITAPTPELAQFAAQVLAREVYKPAVCRGAPCDMAYPFNMKFSTHMH
ncbi:MAG: hypothetical protein QFF03_20875 [Pseudomonadota bacterium]|nr:hypothetical protein [Pseudomonadota bacterium]